MIWCVSFKFFFWRYFLTEWLRTVRNWPQGEDTCLNTWMNTTKCVICQEGFDWLLQMPNSSSVPTMSFAINSSSTAWPQIWLHACNEALRCSFTATDHIVTKHIQLLSDCVDPSRASPLQKICCVHLQHAWSQKIVPNITWTSGEEEQQDWLQLTRNSANQASMMADRREKSMELNNRRVSQGPTC